MTSVSFSHQRFKIKANIHLLKPLRSSFARFARRHLGGLLEEAPPAGWHRVVAGFLWIWRQFAARPSLRLRTSSICQLPIIRQTFIRRPTSRSRPTQHEHPRTTSSRRYLLFTTCDNSQRRHVIPRLLEPVISCPVTARRFRVTTPLARLSYRMETMLDPGHLPAWRSIIHFHRG